MGSKYFGDFGNNERSSSSSSSSSRKGKKNTDNKPKQPQRGLGVAQLEKIRIHSQLGPNFHPSSVVHNPYASSYTQEDQIRLQTAHSSFSYSSSSSPSYGYQGHHGVMMGLPDLDRINTTYGDSQPNSVARWQPGYENQHLVEPSMTRSFFDPIVLGTQQDRNDRVGSGTEAGNSQEIDLELRL